MDTVWLNITLKNINLPSHTLKEQIYSTDKRTYKYFRLIFNTVRPVKNCHSQLKKDQLLLIAGQKYCREYDVTGTLIINPINIKKESGTINMQHYGSALFKTLCIGIFILTFVSGYVTCPAFNHRLTILDLLYRYMNASTNDTEYQENYHIGHDAREPDFVACEQQKRRPACAFTQSDQHLCYSVSGKYTD